MLRVVTVMSEFSMHVVKPVVVRTSLADTVIVDAARNGIPTSHREDSDGGLILSRNSEERIRRSLSCATQGGEQKAVRQYVKGNGRIG